MTAYLTGKEYTIAAGFYIFSSIMKHAALILLLIIGCGCNMYAQTSPTADTLAHPQSADTTTRNITHTDTTLTSGMNRQDSMKVERKVETKEDMARAENDKRWIKTQIQALSFYKMHGRGYVKGGRDSAARYILKKFEEFRLKPIGPRGSWAQGFSFPVNTFPGRMYLEVNGDSLAPGFDFLIDPASPSFKGSSLKVKRVDLAGVNDSTWKGILAGIEPGYVYCFDNVDSLCDNVLHIHKSRFAALLPAGAYIIPETGKLTWSVSRENIKATVFYVDKSVLRKNPRKVSVDVDAVLLPHAHSDNIIACVPGEIKDSFIVFSAHYDHLGMMGDTTFFPGASDNASGTAMLLYLASYFAKHPQRYTIVFIAFAGEEAALMGSEFFVSHPFFPLKNIKFLTNLDIMGDATNGVTVVNATEFPKEFDLLKQINEKHSYLPQIRSRGKAANSDHYYFTEAGVPSFFIYSDGGHGYYHDVYDRAREVTLAHIDDVAQMLIEFTRDLCGGQ